MLRRHAICQNVPILKGDHVWLVNYIFEDTAIQYFGIAKYKSYGINTDWHEVEVLEHTMFPYPRNQAIVKDELFGFVSRPIH